VPNDVDGLAGEGRQDLLAEPTRPEVDPGDRVDPCHQNLVPGGAEPVGDVAEIGRQGQPTQADPPESKQAVGQHDRGLKPKAHRRRGSQA
jgi:hypothetical protein